MVSDHSVGARRQSIRWLESVVRLGDFLYSNQVAIFLLLAIVLTVCVDGGLSLSG